MMESRYWFQQDGVISRAGSCQFKDTLFSKRPELKNDSDKKKEILVNNGFLSCENP